MLVQIAPLRERIDEQGFNAVVDARTQVTGDLVIHTLAEVEPLRSDIVREVLSGRIVQTPHAPLAVLLIGGLIPDFTYPVRHPGSHSLRHHEPVQNLVTLRLSETGFAPEREGLTGIANAGNGLLQSVCGEIQIQRSSVLFHQREGATLEQGNFESVGTDEAEEPEVEGNLEATIEGILNQNLETGFIALPEVHSDVGEAELSPHLPTIVHDLEALRFEPVTAGAEDLLHSGEQDAVLHRGVAFADHAQNLAVVLTDSGEGRGGRPVGQVETLQPDFEVHAIQRVHDFEVFDFVVRIDHISSLLSPQRWLGARPEQGALGI